MNNRQIFFYYILITTFLYQLVCYAWWGVCKQNSQLITIKVAQEKKLCHDSSFLLIISIVSKQNKSMVSVLNTLFKSCINHNCNAFNGSIMQQRSCLCAQDFFPGVFKGSHFSVKYLSLEEQIGKHSVELKCNFAINFQRLDRIKSPQENCSAKYMQNSFPQSNESMLHYTI